LLPPVGKPALLAFVAAILAIVLARLRARQGRSYVRMRVVPYRGDDSSLGLVVATFEALHKRLQRRWWRRLLWGQPSLGLEVHCNGHAWLGITFPSGLDALVEAALRAAYPSARLSAAPCSPSSPPCVLRLKKRAPFTRRARRFDRVEHERSPAINRLITAMAACEAPAFV
jgi:hypothetical protein